MFSMNLSKLKVNEGELKAFIYQQLHDLEPYVGEGSVSIKMSYTKDEQFAVKILASHEVGSIEAEGTNKDVFTALSSAKDAMIKFLISHDMEDDEEDTANTEREEAIQSIISGKPNKVH